MNRIYRIIRNPLTGKCVVTTSRRGKRARCIGAIAGAIAIARPWRTLGTRMMITSCLTALPFPTAASFQAPPEIRQLDHGWSGWGQVGYQRGGDAYRDINGQLGLKLSW